MKCFKNNFNSVEKLIYLFSKATTLGITTYSKQKMQFEMYTYNMWIYMCVFRKYVSIYTSSMEMSILNR